MNPILRPRRVFGRSCILTFAATPRDSSVGSSGWKIRGLDRCSSAARGPHSAASPLDIINSGAWNQRLTETTKRLQRILKAAAHSLRRFAYAVPASSTAAVLRPRLGWALGGGFARGMAHIGVLKVLQENAIPIDALAGVSAGSIAAAAFASGCTIQEMIDDARKVRWSQFARWTLPRLGFATNERLETMLREMLHRATFEELAIPLAVLATDISTGEAVTFRRGDLARAIRASSAFPGLFAPVEHEGRHLVDGAIVCGVPASSLAEFRVDKVVGVCLNSGRLNHRPTNFFQVVGQAFQIAEARNQATWRPQCDLVIEPDVSGFDWDDFDGLDQLIAAGESATRAALPALRELLSAPAEASGAPKSPA
jgi:NTE family protein